MRTSTSTAALAALLFVTLPAAASPGPRLLPALAAPPSFSFAAREEAPAAGSIGFRDLAVELGAGAGAAVIAVPATLWVASWLGTLSPNLVLAALPSLLLLAAIPPLAVTWAIWFASGAFTARPGRFSPAIWATAGAHVLLVVGAALLGVAAHELGDAALFTLAEAIALPTVAAGTMRLSAPRPSPSLPLLTIRF